MICLVESYMKFVLLILCLSSSGFLFGQDLDSLNGAYEQDNDWRSTHDPKKATLLSVIIPGAGQIYNRKYWKAPIVWAGLGVTLYYADYNNDRYRMYRDAYLAITDNDPGTVDPFNGEFSESFILDNTDFHRRYRDLSYIGFGLVYILNILDANIDGHFVRFDVGDDLTLQINPSISTGFSNAPSLSISVSVR